MGLSIFDGYSIDLTNILVDNGTAAVPSISFTSDSDTGFYRIGANNIGLALGGTIKLDYSAGAFAFQESLTISSTGTLTLGAITLGGTLTTGGNSIDLGSGNVTFTTTGTGNGITVQQTNDGVTGAVLNLYTISASPANSDIVGSVITFGKTSTGATPIYSKFETLIEDVTNATYAASLQWTTTLAANYNIAMTLTGAGVLSVDLGGSGSAAQVDLFDDYDDALVLKQGIQEHNREMLVNMGIAYKKDSGSGYMLNLQPMVKLLAGGIYQTRSQLDELRATVMTRLVEIEQKMALLN